VSRVILVGHLQFGTSWPGFPLFADLAGDSAAKPAVVRAYNAHGYASWSAAVLPLGGETAAFVFPIVAGIPEGSIWERSVKATGTPVCPFRLGQGRYGHPGDLALHRRPG